MSKRKLTQERLKELFKYDPKTGLFTSKTNRPGRKSIDNNPGGYNGFGYRRIMIDRKNYICSRLAFLYMEGYFPEHDVDHINRIRNDDRWANLRHTTRQCNLRNCGLNKRNISRIIGVTPQNKGKKWQVNITISKKQISLGYFNSLINAAIARWTAEKKYNFPSCNTTSTAYLYLKEHGEID